MPHANGRYRWRILVGIVALFTSQLSGQDQPAAMPAATTAGLVRSLNFRQTRHRLRAGERVSVSAPQETIDFVRQTKVRSVTSNGAPVKGFVFGPNPRGDEVVFAASLTAQPGEYAVNLSATSDAGEVRTEAISVTLDPPQPVPSNATRPPVVLLNGFQFSLFNSCPIGNNPFDSPTIPADNLTSQLYADGAPVVYFFDNCVEDRNGSIEELGYVLGQVLGLIRYDNGALVPQVDLVGHSMGGLIVRAYLAGMQTDTAGDFFFSPPPNTRIRKFIEVATPNFGSFLAAENSGVLGLQGKEMIPGSAFLWGLARWNQGHDDLRGVDALAIVGNGGYRPQSGYPPANATDGVVSLTSATLNSFGRDSSRTRILPYCHTDSASTFGFIDCNGPGIADAPEAIAIVRSFLANTTAWNSIGGSATQDPWLSQWGGVFFGLENAAGTQYIGLSSTSWGGVDLQAGGSSTFFYQEFVKGTGSFQAATSFGNFTCGPFTESAGFYTTFRCKFGPAVSSVTPVLTGTAILGVPSGASVTVNGTGFGQTQCSTCGVFAGASPLQILSWTDQAIVITLPPYSGLVQITVQTATGADFLNIFTVPSLIPIGSFAQIASAGTWKFTFDAVNLGGLQAVARLNFSDNSGNPLALPISFPESPTTPPVMVSTLDRTIAPNGQAIEESTGPDNSGTSIGWGQLFGTGSVSGFGIFTNQTFGWNALVPLETRNASKYLLAFDNTGAVVTGVAIANVSTNAANIPVTIRDDSGALLNTRTINLPALGHVSFMLNDPQLGFAVTTGKRGTMEFDSPLGGQISVLGLRVNGAALTTLPVLASTDSPGGAIAHSTYNGGFTSTYYLVNTGASSAQFSLSFFDENGNPLAVPLFLPQSGMNQTTSALTQTLAAGALLIIQTLTNDAAPSVVGSAQLSTTGSISGFEIFRWTTFGQEASVPLETRTPGSFVLVFDNTNGLTTGVALSNVAETPASVPVRIYDDAGNLLATSTMNLPGRGHTSFLLPSSYAGTANRRGMVEFVVPPGGKLSSIGLRAKSDGTLTTIPVLVR